MNEQTSSEERFLKWRIGAIQPSIHEAFMASEAYWSKRCEEMEKALQWYGSKIPSVYPGFQDNQWHIFNRGGESISGGASSLLEAIQNAMKSSL